VSAAAARCVSGRRALTVRGRRALSVRGRRALCQRPPREPKLLRDMTMSLPAL
jgi:hypothetical protein